MVLGSGVSLTLSEDHRVFDSKQGWIEAKDLRKGDKILAAANIPIFGTEKPTVEQIEIEIDRSTLTNTFSNSIFSYDEESLKLFLKRLWYASGRVFNNDESIAYMVWNYAMALDIRHLLLRFGIESFIDEDGNCLINDPVDVAPMFNLLGVEATILEVHSPRRWDTVVNIKEQGYFPVYDLVVDHPDHNFLATDTIIHNSYSLSVLALWHAVCNKNTKVIFFSPGSAQVEIFFDSLDAWIAKNPFLAELNSVRNGNFKNPYHKKSFINGSTISGFILGETSNKRRGLGGHVHLVDEAQELTDTHWQVIKPIMLGDQYKSAKIRNYVTGTIKEPSGQFYERVFKTGETNQAGVVFIPITENKDPYYTPEIIREIELEVNNEHTWKTEYLLELSESDTSVFKKVEIDRASSQDWEYGVHLKSSFNPRFIGIDWDKVSAGTNIVVAQYNPITKEVMVIDREEVPRSEFHFHDACDKALEYCGAYEPQLLVSDQGQAEMQFEHLQMAAIQQSHLGMVGKLEKLAFNQVIEIPNPESGELEKKRVKPFLVGMLQQKMQDNKFHYPAHDHDLTAQLFGYKMVRQTARTTVYTSFNEHIIDCLLFILYGIYLTYEHPFEKSPEEIAKFQIYKPEDIPEEYKLDAQRNFWNENDYNLGRRVMNDIYIPRTMFDNKDSLSRDSW